MLDRLLRSRDASPARPAATFAVEDLEQRQFLSAAGLGVNINDSSSAVMNKAIPMLKRLGVTSVRIWADVSNFSSHTWNGTLQRAIDYGNAGFDVMLTVNTKGGKVPSPAAVKGWFQWAIGNSALKNAVDRWQIGNEPDHAAYWRGSLAQYVTQFLKPAAEVLRPAHEPVVSAGPSWNANDVKTMIGAGLLNYVDYVGYHPYANGVALQKQRISEIRAVVGGRKPIIASEWNIRGLEGNKSAWAAAVKQTMPNISANFARNYYYALIAKSGTMAGPGGIMTTGGAPTAFFSAIASSKGINVAPISVANIATTPTPTTPTTTQPTATVTTPKPAGLTAQALPSVSKVSLFNADTDRVISGYEFLNSGDTIDLSKIGTHNIAIVATTAAGASSVKFVFNGTTKIDNTAPYSAFGDSSAKDFTGTIVHAGRQTLTATPFSQNDGAGVEGATRTFKFNFTDTGGVTPASVSRPGLGGFQLQDAATGKALAGYEAIHADQTIRLKALPTRNIQLVALSTSSTGSVKLSGFGTTVTDNDGPFKLPAWSATTGTYAISATPYDDDNAGGAAGRTLSVKLTFA